MLAINKQQPKILIESLNRSSTQWYQLCQNEKLFTKNYISQAFPHTW